MSGSTTFLVARTYLACTRVGRYHADIAPLPPKTTEGGSPAAAGAKAATGGGLEGQGMGRYRPINWGEFRLKRFAGDYADQGTEEVQISHYLLEQQHQ